MRFTTTLLAVLALAGTAAKLAAADTLSVVEQVPFFGNALLFIVGLLATLVVCALSRLRDKSHGDYGL